MRQTYCVSPRRESFVYFDNQHLKLCFILIQNTDLCFSWGMHTSFSHETNNTVFPVYTELFQLRDFIVYTLVNCTCAIVCFCETSVYLLFGLSACEKLCVKECACVCLRTCVYVRVRVYLCACLCVCVSLCKFIAQKNLKTDI